MPAPSSSPMRTSATLTTVPSSKAIPDPSTAAAMTNRPARESRARALTPAVCHPRGPPRPNRSRSARAVVDRQVATRGPRTPQADHRVDREDDEREPDDAEADPALPRHVLV